MVNKSVITNILFDVIHHVSFEGSVNQIIEKNLPVIIRKLNCFGGAVYKKEGKNFTEKFLFPQAMHRTSVWTEISNLFFEQPIASSPTCGNIHQHTGEYYCFELANYGVLILGRKQEFTTEFSYQLAPLIYLLGTHLDQATAAESTNKSTQKLEEEITLLRTVLDHVPIQVYAKNAQLERVLANKAELEFLGLENESEFVQKTDSELFPNRKLHQNIDKKVQDKNAPILHREASILNVENEEMQALVSKFPIQDKEGKPAGVISLTTDISTKKTQEGYILRKQKMLLGITLATNELLTNSKIDDGMDKCLSILGSTVGVDRTFIYQNFTAKADEVYSAIKYEWDAYGIKSQINKKELKHVSSEVFGLNWQRLNTREPIKILTKELNKESLLRQDFLTEETKSVLIIPIFLHEEFWGFIGYEDCSKERQWTEDDMLLLKSFSNSLSSALTMADSRKELRSMALFTLENPDPVVRVDRAGKVLIENKPAKLLNRDLAKKKKGFYSILSKNLNEENPIEVIEISTGDQFFLATARLSETSEYINIYFSNITKQRQTEQDVIQTNQRIKAQEEKYRNIISNMNLGLMEVDDDGDIQFCNQSFTAISGFELEEIKGKNAATMPFWNSAWNPFLGQDKNTQSHEPYSVEVLTKNKRGEARWWLISTAHNHNDINESTGSIGIYLDITQQKLLESELEKALQKSNEASEAKALFLANMSHEIRTPLHGVIGMIRELQKGDLSLQQSGYVSSAVKASSHLLSVVNNILDITKIETGELNLDPVHFSTQELFDDVYTILHAQAEYKKIAFTVDVEKSVPPTFYADSARIRQILINLAGNAIKFTSKGGVKIRVFNDEASRNVLCVEIKDTGIGIEEKYIDLVFEKFQQEDSSISRKFGGTGLGLFVTKNLVNLLDGDLTISSVKGSGTDILVKLPLPKGDEKRIENKTDLRQTVSFDNAKILLVEDNDMNRLVASYTLKGFNVKVTEAENGLRALAHLKKEKFDIILMDIQMPRMNGLEATKIIRNTLKLDTPIIALSANAFKSEIDKCLEIGMNDYVTKPFEEHELIRVMAKYCKNTVVDVKATGHATEHTEVETPLYDISKLQEMSRGNEAFVVKMLGLFIDRFPGYLDEFKLFLKEDNITAIKQLAHKIKPSVNDMRIVSIQQEIKDIEHFKPEETKRATLDQMVLKVIDVISEVVDDVTDKYL